VGEGTPRVHRGQSILLTGSGFLPGSEVMITFHSATISLGHVTATDTGMVQALVQVPPFAAEGRHHFEESGPTAGGRTADVLTAVQVVGVPGSDATTATEKAVLVAIAIMLPVGAWLGMSATGRLRRRGRQAT
jgi:hypothetical protein